jgi:FkbM family methyltransferase
MLKHFVRKIHREIARPLSSMCLKSTKVNYMDKSFRIPLIHGIGAGHHMIKNDWMSKSLGIFLKSKDGVVVDIGANIGLYLLKLRALDDNRQYYGFEPNSLCNYYIQELVRLNSFENVKIFPYALSNKRELRTFYAGRKADKMGSLNKFVRENGKRPMNFSFSLITFPGDELFDLLALKKIGVIKIDVEGAEFLVLEGMKKAISKSKPYMYVEVWPFPKKSQPFYANIVESRHSIYNLLMEIDYRIFTLKPNKSVIMVDSIEDFDNIVIKDCIFAHASNSEDVLNAFNRNFS